MTEPDIIINCRKISFSYKPNREILRDISFSVIKGDTVTIAGISGCGKSTLLRLISDILPGDLAQSCTGEVTITGQTAAAYRKTGKLSFMFQEPALMPNLTVYDNVGLPLSVRGIVAKNKVDEMLEKIGLSEHRNRLPKELSGGMKTRVALARSFITDPEILLLDEPFSSLDIAWKRSLYIELEMLRARCGTTVVLVTHDVQEALLLSGKVIILTSKGLVGDIYAIPTELSVAGRLNDISGFIGMVYQSHMAPIQEAIIADQLENKERHEKRHLLSII